MRDGVAGSGARMLRAVDDKGGERKADEVSRVREGWREVGEKRSRKDSLGGRGCVSAVGPTLLSE